MTRIAYLLFFGLILILVQLLLQNFLILLPLFALFVFYATAVCGLRFALTLGLLGGVSMNFALGYPFPVALLSIPCVCWFSCFWLKKVSSNTLFLHILPGVLVTLIVYLPAFLLFTTFWGGWRMLPLVGLSMLLSGLLLPMMIVGFDALNGWFALPRYVDKILESQS